MKRYGMQLPEDIQGRHRPPSKKERQDQESLQNSQINIFEYIIH